MSVLNLSAPARRQCPLPGPGLLPVACTELTQHRCRHEVLAAIIFTINMLQGVFDARTDDLRAATSPADPTHRLPRVGREDGFSASGPASVVLRWYGRRVRAWVPAWPANRLTPLRLF